MESIKDKAAHGVVWSAIERFSLQGVQFVLQLVMARLLSPNDYGLIGMLAIFMGVSQVFIDGGFSNALIRTKNRSESDFCTVFFINVGISLLLYLVLFFTAPYIALFFDEPLLIPITRVYSINLVINSLVAVNKVKLTVSVDFKTLSKISLSAATLSGIIGIFCAFHGMGVWALVLQTILNATINVFVSFYYVRWFPHAFISIESFKRLFGYGSKLLIASLIHSIYSNIYNLVIGKRYTSSDLGLFTRAQQFPSFAGSNVSDILQRVSFPILSDIQDDDCRLLLTYRKYINIATWVAFPLLLGICGVARPLVIVLLTDKWIDCVPYIQLLCFAMLTDCITRVNLNLLYVKGRSDWVLRLEVIKKSIAITILIITMFYGIKVICCGRIVYSVIALYLNTYYTNKLYHYGFFQQVREVVPQLSIAVIMMLICFVILHCISVPIISLLVSIPIAIVFYLFCSKCFNLYAYQEVRVLIKEKLDSFKK